MRAIVVTAAVLATCMGCAGGDAPAGDARVVPIESAAPLWAANEGWRVADAPGVSVGAEVGDDPYMFYRVRGALQFDNGRILVSDAGAYEVRLFDGEGVFVSSSGGQAQGPGEYGEPPTMDLFGPTKAGHVLVSDAFNGRLNVLDADGVYVTQITLASVGGASGGGIVGLFGDGSLLSVAVDGDNALRGDPGTIIRMRYQLRRFSDEGEPLQLLAYADSRPRFVNEVGGVTNYPYIPFTAEAQRAAAGDKLWMSSGADPEVWAVDFDGNEVNRVRWRPADRRRSADMYDRFVEESLAGLDNERRRTQYQHLYRQDLPIPEHIPLHQEMVADALGNLWLERYRLPWETRPRWDVVDPRRGWLGVVETPPGFQVMQLGAESLVGVHRDEDGVARVQVFALLK